MEKLFSELPNAGNLISYVTFLVFNYFIIKKQVEKLTDLGNKHTTDIAVIEEKITSVKAKIENGLSTQIKDTSERVAKLEGHCESIHCVKENK